MLLSVIKKSNALGLKVIKEGRRQMLPLKIVSAGRGSRTSRNIDPSVGPGGSIPWEEGAKRQCSKRQVLREAKELLVRVAKPRISNHLNTWLGIVARSSRKRSRE